MNFFADLIRLSLDTDIAIFNAGLLRADHYYTKGVFMLKDLMAMLPYNHPLTKLEVTGETIIKILENGVSKIPALEGRFPFVSAMTYEVDQSKPPGERVVASSIKIKGKPIDLKKHYTLAVTQYMSSGMNFGLRHFH